MSNLKRGKSSARRNGVAFAKGGIPNIVFPRRCRVCGGRTKHKIDCPDKEPAE